MVAVSGQIRIVPLLALVGVEPGLELGQAVALVLVSAGGDKVH
jgi:hypothetical protein